MNDEALLRGCLLNDPDAWAQARQLVVRLVQSLGVTRYHLRPDEVEDVVQSTMLELLKNDCQTLRVFQGRSRLTTYLATIVLRVASGCSRTLIPEVPLDSIPFLESQHEPMLVVDDHAYQDCLQQLAPLDSTILKLLLDGYHTQEIADFLTRTQGRLFTSACIRKRKQRAMLSLRLALTECPA